MPPPAEACKSTNDCGNEASQCLADKFLNHSDKASVRIYYVDWGQSPPKIVNYGTPSDEDNADYAECGGELAQCLAERC